jgi:hypothetical protein
MREIGATSVGADLVGCRMARHFEVEDFSVSVPNYQEDVKRLEQGCSDAEPKCPMQGALKKPVAPKCAPPVEPLL